MNRDKKIILVIDDDIDYLEQMKIQITSFGFLPILAESQKEGEEKINEIKPDLVIVDLMMENQDSGFIFCYKIKKKFPEVPVIIASAVTAETGMIFGLNSEEDRNWIKADQYLEKGIRPDQLQREINKLLKL
ncbi:MAG: response regulator [Bacteroidales bacterium]|nr:response regulator [Bacteroidales bacterium]